MHNEYSPKKYWEERAKLAVKDIYQAVCAYGRSHIENKAMDIIQKKVFASMLKGVDLRGKKVLELGCGVGRWVPFITSYGAKYVGVDISENMIEVARKRFPNASFYKIDSTDLPFPDNSFYLSFSITVIHHNNYDAQSKLIDELVRVTQPNGYIFLLEGIAHGGRKKTWFNTFARPVHDWVSEVEKGGRAKLVKIKYVRYWILRDIFRKTLGIIGIDNYPKAVNDMLVKIDYYVDYYLLAILPRKKAVAAAMLFKKTGKIT
ncbi:Methyltransferase domain protein [Pyrodictium delaneyi]|nr:class I SAM-dependent methyltransferase [Pyrodictium delaneyi]ALL01991.1 Methyltransferase domain protein [Pyrodictium delaneyi]